MAKDFQTNVIIGGKINPNLKKVFDVAGKYAAKTADIIAKTNNRVEASMTKLQTKASNVAQTAKKSAMVGAVIGGAAIVGGKAMIDQAASMEKYRGVLNTVMKDQTKAAETFSWAVKFANETPFETDEIVAGTVKLQSYGLEAQKVLPLVGDMAFAMGKSMDQAVEAIADAQTGELERLREFAISKEQIVQHGAKVMKGIELVNNKGQITNQKAFNATLLNLIQERYKGAMEANKNSWGAIMSNITGIWKTGLAKIAGAGEGGLPVQGSFFDIVKKKAAELAEVLAKMQSDGTFDKLRDKLGQFTSKAIEGIEKLLPKVMEFAKYIKDNGPEILDKIKKIGMAFLGWKVVSGVTTGITTILALADALSVLNTRYLSVAKAKAKDILETLYIQSLYAKDAIVMWTKTAATWAMTAAQTALNAAMSIGAMVGKAFGAVLSFLASPIGIVILSITALIGIGYLLYKNWDTISKALVTVWQNNVVPFFQGIGAWFSGIFASIGGAFKGMINWTIGGINNMISALNKVQVNVPDWVPGIGGKTIGFNVAQIPTFAKGGFTNRPSIFGEAGLEAAIPIKPKNPRSISLLNQTAKALGVSPAGGSGSGQVVNHFSINVTAQDGEKESIAEATKEAILTVLEQYFHDKDRLSFE